MGQKETLAMDARDRATTIRDHAARTVRYVGVSLIAPLLCGIPMTVCAALIGSPFPYGSTYFGGAFLAGLFYSTPVVWVLGPVILWCFHALDVRGARSYLMVGAVVGFATSLFIILDGSGSFWISLAVLCVGTVQGTAVGTTLYALTGDNI
jgi:hypothetical protein